MQAFPFPTDYVRHGRGPDEVAAYGHATRCVLPNPQRYTLAQRLEAEGCVIAMSVFLATAKIATDPGSPPPPPAHTVVYVKPDMPMASSGIQYWAPRIERALVPGVRRVRKAELRVGTPRAKRLHS